MPKDLTIYGSILDVQTRNLMVICDRCGLKYKFVEVDTRSTVGENNVAT